MDDEYPHGGMDDEYPSGGMDSSLEDHGITPLIHSKSGSTAAIHEVGATLLNFHPSPDKYSEVLFVSSRAVLNGTKAIRGGIPVVFPIFGPPTEPGSDMPQHGFARTNVWKMDRSSIKDNDEFASVDFTLVVAPEDDMMLSRGTKGLWAPSASAPACELRFKIVITATTLSTTLTMKNTGSVAFPVQALFHTYFHVHQKAALEGTKCYVKGLQGYEMVDKVDASKSTKSSQDETVTIVGETDRVYSPPADGSKDEVHVTVSVANPRQPPILCTANASVDGTSAPVSCVVWNPHADKSKQMSDFATQEYHEMICVEPGLLTSATLEPTKEAVLEMIINVEP